MKHFLQWALGWPFIYLCMGFLLNDYNPVNWSKAERWIVIFFGLICGAIIWCACQFIEDEKKQKQLTKNNG